jgi:hypothetical protein
MNEVLGGFLQRLDQGAPPEQTLLPLKHKDLVTGNIRDNKAIAGRLSVRGQQCEWVEESVARTTKVLIPK